MIISAARDADRAEEDLRELGRALFDGPGAARRILGRPGSALGAAETEELVWRLGDVLQRASLDRVRARLPRDRPPAIRFVAEEMGAGGRVALVRTVVRANDGADVRVDYIMTRASNDWLVHDVVIDGISLIENYRAQVAQIVRVSSYAGLMARLKAIAPSGGPLETPPPVITYFGPGRTDLGPASRRDVETVATWLRANGHVRVVVEGHSDDRGDSHANHVLAERRASTIRSHLVALGVSVERVAVVSRGDRQPVCHESHEACWGRNRRAVLRITPERALAPAASP
jgi:outer membrane protein OmpA-like peptidoglycan-associated protein